MKLFRRIFLVGMLLSSTLFFFQCSSCEEDKVVEAPPVVPYTAIQQLIGSPKSWTLTSAKMLKEGVTTDITAATGISISFTATNTFSTVVKSGVESPTGTSATGTYAVTGAGTGDLKFNAGAVGASTVSYTLTPFATDKLEYATKLVLVWTITVTNKPAVTYTYTYTR